jgi:hypothetical protein
VGATLKVRKLAGFLSAKWREPEPCEACGEPFTCGATIVGCWCTEVKLDKATRGELRSRYDRCLCRACLDRYAKAENRAG